MRETYESCALFEAGWDGKPVTGKSNEQSKADEVETLCNRGIHMLIFGSVVCRSCGVTIVPREKIRGDQTVQKE